MSLRPPTAGPGSVALDCSASTYQRWLAVAARVARRGYPSPNPRVGAVLLDRAGQFVAWGYHARVGAEHAEVMALRAAGARAHGGTMVVTLEPCNHFGRTPPCTETLIDAGVARVVIGAADPMPHLPGARARMVAAGIEVLDVPGVAAVEALVLDFAKYRHTGMPYVTLKAALTMDGFSAARDGSSKWITGAIARRHVHAMRRENDAILVGAGTVAADDPELTVRHLVGPNPLRVILDSKLRSALSARVFAASAVAPTLVVHSDRLPDESVEAFRRSLSSPHVALVAVPENADGLCLRTTLLELGRRNVVRLLVEGGSRIHGTFLRAGLADHVALFFAPKILGDPQGIGFAQRGPAPSIAASLQLRSRRFRRLGCDWLVEGRLVDDSPVKEVQVESGPASR